jgi:hypothetical protein
MVRWTVVAVIVAGSTIAPAWAEEQKAGAVQPGPLSLYSAADLGGVAPALRIGPIQERATRRLEPDAARRPGALVGLYASLAGLNALDVYSTRRALNSGAREVNPVMASTSGNFGAMLAIKAATTTSSIYLAEKLWKKNRAAAIVTMVAVNGATAAIAARNFNNAR